MQRFYNSLSGHDLDNLRNIWVEDDAVQVSYHLFILKLIRIVVISHLLVCSLGLPTVPSGTRTQSRCETLPVYWSYSKVKECIIVP